jgi:hypothetical protein
MIYMDMPVIIPVLATCYLVTIYLLLTLAQRTIKNSRYVDNSLTDAYAHASTEPAPQTNDEVERWSLQVSGAASFASQELPPSGSPPPSIQEASSLP